MLKVAIVTGSSSGIGAAAALKFAALGYRLALHARNVPVDDAGLAETKHRCLKANPKLTEADIVTMTGDLSVDQDCQSLVQNTVGKFKRLDVLVANAGVLGMGGLQHVKMDDFDRIMRLNCRSVLYLNKLAVPHLEETKGNIVNVSSLAGFKPDANMLVYGMSKAAVIHLTRCAAVELGPKGIRVNAVCPGVILPTKLMSNAGLETNLIGVTMERVKSMYPLGRAGTPEEVAQSIAFLATEETASYMTGVTLSIDGGRFCT